VAVTGLGDSTGRRLRARHVHDTDRGSWLYCEYEDPHGVECVAAGTLVGVSRRWTWLTGDVTVTVLPPEGGDVQVHHIECAAPVELDRG
jgi:hypothetical protein